MVLLSTHNIRFGSEIRKLFFWYALLTKGLIGPMVFILWTWRIAFGCHIILELDPWLSSFHALMNILIIEFIS